MNTTKAKCKMRGDVKHFEFIVEEGICSRFLTETVSSWNPNNHVIRLFYDHEFLRRLPRLYHATSSSTKNGNKISVYFSDSKHEFCLAKTGADIWPFISTFTGALRSFERFAYFY